MTSAQTLARVLAEVAAGDLDSARSGLADALAGAAAHSPLAVALAQHIDRADGSVYDSPAAFRAFIGGGGNVELYRVLSNELAHRYRHLVPSGAAGTRLVDIGAGDGQALVPALKAAPAAITDVTVVEPSAALAEVCDRRLSDLVDDGVIATATVVVASVEDWLGESPPGECFDLAQSTFALHSLAPQRRGGVLGGLAERAERLVVAEFDVQVGPADDGWLQHLVERYEQGLAEYEGTQHRDLVVGGFLVPVLLGQIDEARHRATFEQSRQRWRAQLAEAGFDAVEQVDLVDYWWAPAVLFDAGRR